MAELRLRFNTPHLQLRLGEWFTSFVLFALGLFLLSFRNVMANGIEYRVMLEWAGGVQMVWAIGLWTNGAVRLVALYINGRKPITPFIRAGLSFFSCFVWWQLSLGFMLTNVPKTGWVIYPAFLVLELYNTVNAFADARKVWDQKRASNGTKVII